MIPAHQNTVRWFAFQCSDEALSVLLEYLEAVALIPAGAHPKVPILHEAHKALIANEALRVIDESLMARAKFDSPISPH